MIKYILLLAGLVVMATFSGCKSVGSKKRSPLTLYQTQHQIPILINKEDNPVLSMCIENTAGDKTFLLKEIKVTLNGTTRIEDMEQVKIYFCGPDSSFSSANRFGLPADPAPELVFRDEVKLKRGKNYFWLSVKLRTDAGLLHQIDAGCLGVMLGGGKRMESKNTSPPVVQRIGVAVRKHGDDGVHTYRIPGLAVSAEGTLLAIYDVRRNSSRDLQGDIDIGLSRSTDGGQSWEPMRIALDMNSWGGLPEKFNGVSDANIMTDHNTGDIFIAGLWMYGVLDENGRWIEGLNEKSRAWNHQWRDKGSQPGFGVKQTAQFLITRSKDDGKTWGKPENLTKQLKKELWWLFAPAPGSGITMGNGILVMPTQGRDEKGLPFSNIIYSMDHGKTWNASQLAYNNTTESAVVQLEDGSLMLNMRDNRNREAKGIHNGRAIAVSGNLGETWTEHPTSHGALQEPVCMASLIRHVYHDKNGKQKSILLFSNPNDKYQRKGLTIKVSFDKGMTWPDKYWILLDAGLGRGYSSLTSIDEGHIGILYEGSQADMTFEKIDLKEILHR